MYILDGLLKQNKNHGWKIEKNVSVQYKENLKKQLKV